MISRQLQFVEIDGLGHARTAGYAPYLDYRPLEEEERTLVASVLERMRFKPNQETQALSHAVQTLVPGHFEEVRRRKEELVSKTLAAVKDRLTKEIIYWDHRANQLKDQELAGKTPRLNSGKARERANELDVRLKRRLEELEQERRISPLPPVAIGGALVVPAGLLARLKGERHDEPDEFARETARVEKLAMDAVMESERRLGFEPRDVSEEKCGYDVESRILGKGRLRFIEVKGRVSGAKTVTITKNEILTALNKPEDFILALVEVVGEDAKEPRYIRRPFQREPDFGVTSVNYDFEELLARAERPR
jgi:hypothetical protein